jgi:hypothetical protein
MEIMIMTFGRCHRQSTWQNLPASIRDRAWLVIQEQEVVEHVARGYNKLKILPKELDNAGIGKARQWVIDNVGPRVVMLDDDLEFATRRADEPTKFNKSSEQEIEQMFDCIADSLEEGYAMVGVAAREGANRITDQFLYATRQMRIHGINTEVARSLNIRYDRIPVMEDFDVILQFLERGYRNRVLNGWVSNQHGSNVVGGCSTYRTAIVQSNAARMLADLHPGFVKVVRKKTKTSWGGEERTDVTIQWKKAYESSRITSVLDRGTGESEASEGTGGPETVVP